MIVILLLFVAWLLAGGVLLAIGCPETLAVFGGLLAPILLVAWAIKRNN